MPNPEAQKHDEIVPPEQAESSIARHARMLTMLTLLCVACAGKEPSDKPIIVPNVHSATKPAEPDKPLAPAEGPLRISREHIIAHPNRNFDNDPRYFDRSHENGEFSKEELGRFTKTLGPGVTVLYDHGLIFYKVQKGDDLKSIFLKLAKHFPYLTEMPKQKNKFFNLTQLKEGMLIPIPISEKDRQISNEDFAAYQFLAFQALLDNDIYDHKLKDLMKATQMKPEDFVHIMLAVARQESGGLPLGKFQLFRQEPTKDKKDSIREACYSYTHFHILQDQYKIKDKHYDRTRKIVRIEDGPGLRARKNLKMTEGQTIHPINAGMLFLSYLMEKVTTYDTAGRERRFSLEKLKDIFPVFPNGKKFAHFYNGGGIESDNYEAQIKIFYLLSQETMRLFTGKKPLEITEADIPNRMCTVFNCSLEQIITDSNSSNSLFTADNQSILKSNENVKIMADMIRAHLAKKHNGDSRLFPGDKVQVFIDAEKGPFVKFTEGNGITDHQSKARKGKKPHRNRLTRPKNTPGAIQIFYFRGAGKAAIPDTLKPRRNQPAPKNQGRPGKNVQRKRINFTRRRYGRR